MKNNNPHQREKIAFAVLFASTVVVVLPVIFVLFYIVKQGWSALSWEFLTAMPRNGMREGGIFPAIVGTLYLVVGTMIFSLPLGVLSAIYLTEYAKDNLVTRFVKLAIINLAGVPSVVYGLFGLGIFVMFLNFGASILAGSLTLAIMVIPIIITTSKEALDSVPQSFRQVSLSLGVSKWQTIRYCVLPHALPGILTGTILAISRAAGETAPILFTVAAFYLPKLPQSIFDQAMALPYHLYVMSTQVPHVKVETRYGIALVLLILVLTMNFIAVIIRSKFRRLKRW